MTDKYCPRNEIKKLEAELWNLKVKGTNVTGYNQRFQELSLLCVVECFLENIKLRNKRKLDNNHQAQQQLPNRQNVVQAYAAGTGERKEYAGTLPHYKMNCPKIKEPKTGKPRPEGTGTHGMVLALGGGETDQDPNNIEDEIEA
ncbi:hypothetical protein Tco_0720757 [Tanacetum coccineum]